MKLLRRKRKVDFWDGLPGLADSDDNPLMAGWYSMDDVLSALLVPALDHFIDHTISHPGDLHPGEWHFILVKIRDGFAAHMQLTSLDYDPSKTEELTARMNEGLRLFSEWYGHLWD